MSLSNGHPAINERRIRRQATLAYLITAIGLIVILAGFTLFMIPAHPHFRQVGPWIMLIGLGLTIGGFATRVNLESKHSELFQPGYYVSLHK